jgi:hypothetical protein
MPRPSSAAKAQPPIFRTPPRFSFSSTGGVIRRSNLDYTARELGEELVSEQESLFACTFSLPALEAEGGDILLIRFTLKDLWDKKMKGYRDPNSFAVEQAIKAKKLGACQVRIVNASFEDRAFLYTLAFMKADQPAGRTP